MSGGASKDGPSGAMRVSFETVLEDRVCRCGYNLKGLDVRGVCPECGAPVTEGSRARGKRRTNVSGSLLGTAPGGYLALLSAGLLGIVLGGLLVAVGISMDFFDGWGAVSQSKWVSSAVWIASGLLWSAGSALVAMPRPGEGTREPRAEGWVRACRMLTCVTQSAIPLSQLLLVSFPLWWLAEYLSIAGLGVAAIGWPALALVIGELADWGRNTSLMTRLRSAAWCLTIPPMVVLGISLTIVLEPTFSLLLIVVVAAWGLWIGGWLVMYVGALELLVTVRWAVLNQRELEARDVRRAARLAAHVPGSAPELHGAGVPLATGGLVRARVGSPDGPASGTTGPEGVGEAEQGHSSLPPPGVPRPGEKNTPRIEPTRDVTPYGLEETGEREPA